MIKYIIFKVSCNVSYHFFGLLVNDYVNLSSLYFVAIHVYGVSQAQLAALLVIKMLGQNSIEAYIHQ